MSKRSDLEGTLWAVYRINPEVQGYDFDVSSWADNILDTLGVDIKTTETVVIK